MDEDDIINEDEEDEFDDIIEPTQPMYKVVKPVVDDESDVLPAEPEVRGHHGKHHKMKHHKKHHREEGKEMF